MFFHKQYEDFYTYHFFSYPLSFLLHIHMKFCITDTKLSSPIGGKTMIILYLCTVFNLENK